MAIARKIPDPFAESDRHHFAALRRLEERRSFRRERDRRIGFLFPVFLLAVAIVVLVVAIVR